MMITSHQNDQKSFKCHSLLKRGKLSGVQIYQFDPFYKYIISAGINNEVIF